MAHTQGKSVRCGSPARAAVYLHKRIGILRRLQEHAASRFVIFACPGYDGRKAGGRSMPKILDNGKFRVYVYANDDNPHHLPHCHVY